ncbi:MAG: metal-dependent hydrolase [Thermacetogeniaceae bacterium]
MTGKTHLAAGALAGAAVGRLTGCPLAGLAVGALAGLLPDIDEPHSTVGRRALPISIAVNLFAGHRGVTHTVWFCAGAGILFAFISAAVGGHARALLHGWPHPLAVGLAAFLGALSHLLVDACTRSGVEPFAPLRLPEKLKWLEHPKGPIATGTELVETPLAILLFILSFKIGGVF